MKQRDVLAVFNRGRISRHAIARTDVARVALSAEVQSNWMPNSLGSMMMRPGLEYIGESGGDGAMHPFIYSTDDTAIVELSASTLRVWNQGETLVTRPSVSASITNGGFASDITGWTNADDSGSTSDWATGPSSTGVMRLVGTGSAAARRRQQVTVSGGQQNTTHAVRIEVARGPVIFRVGSTAGGDDIFRQAVLREGTHSIAFVPGGNFFVEFESYLTYTVLIESIAIEGSGVMSIATPWTTAATCKLVRTQQSGDVLFCACTGQRPRRIERRPNNSWSLVYFIPEDGPFLTENLTTTTITPSAITGSMTLTASRPLWQDGHIGALWRLTSQGQLVEASLSAETTYSGYIRVTGVTDDRKFTITRAGTWTGTVTLQRSISEPGAWVDVQTYTGNGSSEYDDGLDNSIAYYRLGFNAGDYSSGTAELSMEFSSGSITGVVRLTDVVSPTSATCVVLSDLGGTDATSIWAEGAWSEVQDWPEAVAVWEGRSWWSGKGRNWGSVSDAFDTFDPDYEGDAGPINRRVGEGAANRTNWMLPLQRLIVGTDSAEHSIRSTSFDEPVTPLNYNTKSLSTKGSTQVDAASADGKGYFVARDGKRVFEVEYDAAVYGFTARDATVLCPEIGEAGVVRVFTQMSPELRVHCILSDGTAAILIRNAIEDVMCWVNVETDGDIEDVCVLPGAGEDRVFYRVKRTVDGNTVRYHEEWAHEDQARGGTANRIADSFVAGTQSASATISGLDHLEGETVVIWGDGADLGTATVSGGAVTAPSAVETYCVGLGYSATYKSAKLAGQTGLGLSLTQRSRINHLGLILADTHAQGLEFGPDFTTMDGLPMMEDGQAVDQDSVWESYDEDGVEFPGDWSTDNRICLRATAPRPCTVLAAVINVDRQDSA